MMSYLFSFLSNSNKLWMFDTVGSMLVFLMWLFPIIKLPANDKRKYICDQRAVSKQFMISKLSISISFLVCDEMEMGSYG